jgi:hypothetical protein
MDTWILKTVRTRSVRRVTAWAAALVCLALLAFGQSRYIQNFLMGPYDLGPADLDSIRDVSEAPRYFARVSSKAIVARRMRRDGSSVVRIEKGSRESIHSSAGPPDATGRSPMQAVPPRSTD